MKSESKGPELVHNVSEAFRRGSQKASNQVSLYQYFGLSGDPFDTECLLKHPDLISNSTRFTLSRLAERAGFAAESKAHMLFVGPEGAGKTLLLRLLAQTLNQSMGVDFSAYVDASATWSRQPISDEEHETDGFQTWAASLDFKTTRLVLVDNADSFMNDAAQYFSHLARSVEEPPVVLYSVTYPSYWYAVKDDQLSKTFKVHLWTQQQDRAEVENTIRASIASCKMNSDPFEDGAYRAIASHSLGLPGLAVDLAIGCLQFASSVGVSHIRKEVVDRIASILLFRRALSIVESGTKLEGTKAEIALEALREFYLRGEIRRSWLVSAFSNLARSTLAYHFKDLVDDEILIPERFGFRMRYKIARPVRSALQIMEAQNIQVT